MGLALLRDEVPNIAYSVGTYLVSSPPRYFDYHTEDGRTHVHVVADSWEVRISWHRLD